MRLLIVKFQIIYLLLIEFHLSLRTSNIIFKRLNNLSKIRLSLNWIKLTKPFCKSSFMISILIKDVAVPNWNNVVGVVFATHEFWIIFGFFLFFFFSFQGSATYHHFIFVFSDLKWFGLNQVLSIGLILTLTGVIWIVV